MSNFRYERGENGRYILRDGTGQQVLTTDCPAILFDRSNGVLHKHGDFQRVRKQSFDMKTKYTRIGAPHMAEEIIFFATKNWDIEELNRCVNINGYCQVFYERITRQ